MADQNKHPILLVDDEPEILYSLRGLLRRDFEVYTAESGAEALELLHQHPIHVIMTDQRMPEMTGVELLARVRGECPEAIRIVFTGYADIKAVVDAINQGRIYRYITKPWDPDELLEVLREAAAYYEQTADRKRLLADLRSHISDGVQLLKRFQQQLCDLPEQNTQAEIERFAENSGELLQRMEQVLGTD